MRYYRLDLNLLIVFDAIFRNGSVLKAAGELYLTPPAVSNALARLREHFNDELFIPNGRRMLPTPFAELIHEDIIDLLDKARNIATARAEFDPSHSTRGFSLVASDYTTQIFLLNTIPKIRKIAPNIGISIVSISEDSLAQFQNGEIDLLIAPDDVVAPQFFSSLLFTDQFAIVAWKNSHWPDEISEKDFFEASHVLAEPGAFRLSESGTIQSINKHIEYSSKVEGFFSKQIKKRKIALCVPFFFSVPSALIGTDQLATLPLRLIQTHPLSKELKILKCDIKTPEVSEYLHWSSRLIQDPGGKWLKEKIASDLSSWQESEL